MAVTYHGGPLDGEPLDLMAPPSPHDDGYEVRTAEGGVILGAWWRRPEPIQNLAHAYYKACLERDAARGEVERLRLVLDAINDCCDHSWLIEQIDAAPSPQADMSTDPGSSEWQAECEEFGCHDE